MTVFKNNNSYVTQDMNFVGSATSDAVDLSGSIPVAIITPASFGATTITFTASTTLEGTFYPVYNETGALITATVSSANASWTDITNIFPSSVGGFIKLVAGSSITKTVQLVSRNAA